MKIRIYFIFLFACIFLIGGCGQKNSRAEFQQIASNVEMDSDRANIYEFEMYLPKGYIQYIPDSKKSTSTTVILPSGKEKEVKCPYALSNYKKNELEESAEIVDTSARRNIPPELEKFLENTKLFINYESKSILYVMPIRKEQEGGSGLEATMAPQYNNALDRFVNLSMLSVKKELEKNKNSSHLKEYDLSSDETNIKFFNAQVKSGPFGFMDVASVRTSRANAFIIFCQKDEKTYNDIAAILISIKPISNKK